MGESLGNGTRFELKADLSPSSGFGTKHPCGLTIFPVKGEGQRQSGNTRHSMVLRYCGVLEKLEI